MEKKQIIIGVSAGLGIIVLILGFVAIAAMSGKRDPNRVGPSAKLETDALEGSTMAIKEKAAADLARSSAPDATESLLRILNDSKDPEVLVCVIDGLGRRASQKDRDTAAMACMPKLVKILEDEKGLLQVEDQAKINLIRARAYVAISKIVGFESGWNPDREQNDEELDKLKRTLDWGKEFRVPG